uniref:Pyrroline-5-carboxylate reductase n=1 Tax=Esox lucius TaxID=8010 RepID=A0A3P8X822_ESOLU
MAAIMDESETWNRWHGTLQPTISITLHEAETDNSEQEAAAAQSLQDNSTLDLIIKTDPETPLEMDSNLRIGFIGAGNMAYGIAKGLLQSGDVPPTSVKVSAPSARNFVRFQELGVAVTHSNEEVIHSCNLVFVAVKPHLVAAVLGVITKYVTQKHIIVSVAAGVTLVTLEGLLPTGSVVLRLMPNLPCLVQQGALLFSRGTHAQPEDGALLRSLLQPCGLVEEGPEAWIDIHTGLSGSGVAFVYLFAEALAEGAVKMGMPSALAHSIAAQTVLGAGQLLRDSGKHPAQLRSEVCTPGGTTIFGLHAMEQGGVRAATMTAVEIATERARDLGRKPSHIATDNRK